MSDLVARLRAEAKALRQFASEDDDYPADIAALIGEAAARIEALEKTDDVVTVGDLRALARAAGGE